MTTAAAAAMEMEGHVRCRFPDDDDDVVVVVVVEGDAGGGGDGRRWAAGRGRYLNVVAVVAEERPMMRCDSSDLQPDE